MQCPYKLYLSAFCRWLDASPFLDPLLSLTNIFLPSEEEAKGISGQADAPAALETLLKMYGRKTSGKGVLEIAVIKMGAKGAIAGDYQGQRWSQHAFDVQGKGIALIDCSP